QSLPGVRNLVSYRSRFGTPEGELELLDHHGRWSRLEITGGDFESDRQSVHLSENAKFSKLGKALPTLVSLRPHWRWYRAKLPNGCRVMAYVVFNGDEPKPLKQIGFFMTPSDCYRVENLLIENDVDRHEQGLVVALDPRLAFTVGQTAGPYAGRYNLSYS